MAQRLEKVHVRFLIKVKMLKGKRLNDVSWQKVAADRELWRVRTQLLKTYLYRRQVALAEWVALHPIFEVCARDMDY